MNEFGVSKLNNFPPPQNFFGKKFTFREFFLVCGRNRPFGSVDRYGYLSYVFKKKNGNRSG